MTEEDKQSQQNVILHTPVAVTYNAPRLVLWSKVFSWISVSLFLGVMIISLIMADRERDQLRAQVAEQSAEMICRERSDDSLIVAIAQRDEIMTEALIAVAREDSATLMVLVDDLNNANLVVDREISEMEAAVEQCKAE